MKPVQPASCCAPKPPMAQADAAEKGLFGGMVPVPGVELPPLSTQDEIARAGDDEGEGGNGEFEERHSFTSFRISPRIWCEKPWSASPAIPHHMVASLALARLSVSG